MNPKLSMLLIMLLLIGFSMLASPAHAAPHATYQLAKTSVGSGGGGSSGIYGIASSIGQPTAGEGSAGNYTLGGGFWGGGIIVSAHADYNLFLPLIVK